MASDMEETLESQVGGQNGGDWYTCRFCKKNFASKTECSSHRRREHLREKPQVKLVTIGQQRTVIPNEEKKEEQQQKQQGPDLGVTGKVLPADEEPREFFRSDAKISNLRTTEKAVQEEKDPKLFMSEVRSPTVGTRVKHAQGVKDLGLFWPEVRRSYFSSRDENTQKSTEEKSSGQRQGQRSEPTLNSIQSPISTSWSSPPLSLKGVKRKIERQIAFDDDDSTNPDCPVTSTGSPSGHFRDDGETQVVLDLRRVSFEKQGSSLTTTDTAAACSRVEKRQEQMPSCEMENQNELPIPNHIRVLQGKDGDIFYECTVCKKSFKSQANTKYHNFCPDPSQRPFQCPKCGMKFVAHGHLTYHLYLHSGERPFKCSVAGCGAAFRRQGHVNDHMRSHSGERPYSCFICHKGLATRQTLKQHMRIHTGERPYVCGHCDKGFSNKTNLNRHVRTHAADDD